MTQPHTSDNICHPLRNPEQIRLGITGGIGSGNICGHFISLFDHKGCLALVQHIHIQLTGEGCPNGPASLCAVQEQTRGSRNARSGLADTDGNRQFHRLCAGSIQGQFVCIAALVLTGVCNGSDMDTVGIRRNAEQLIVHKTSALQRHCLLSRQKHTLRHRLLRDGIDLHRIDLAVFDNT